MKKIFSLTLALFASGSSVLFAQNGRTNAPLQLRLTDNSPVTILVDGTNYANEGGMLSVNNVVPGEHEIQVFRGALREGTRVPAIKTFKVTTTAQGSTVCVVDPVSGAVDIQNAGRGVGRSGDGNDRNGDGSDRGNGRGGDRGNNGQGNNGNTTTGGTSTPDTSKRHLLARERNRTLSRAYLDNLNKSGLPVVGETVQTGTVGSGSATNNNQGGTNNNGGTRGGNGSGRGNGEQGNNGTNNQGNTSGQNESGNGRGNNGNTNQGTTNGQNSSGNSNNGNQGSNSGQNNSGNYGRGNNNDRENGSSQNNGNGQWSNDGRNNGNSGTQTRADQSNGNTNGYGGSGDNRGGQWNNNNQGNNGNYNSRDNRGGYNGDNRDGNWNNGGGRRDDGRYNDRRDDDRGYNGRNNDREEEIQEPELILLKAKDITAIKAKAAKKSTDAAKNTLLQSEIGDRAFTVEQGRGLLRLLKGETARLQFARWAIDGTIDVENFGKLATEFKLAASKREIKKLAADAQDE